MTNLNRGLLDREPNDNENENRLACLDLSSSKCFVRKEEEDDDYGREDNEVAANACIIREDSPENSRIGPFSIQQRQENYYSRVKS